MDDENQNSSINVLLVISAAIIVIVGGGWFLLDGDSGSAPTVVRPQSLVEATVPTAAPAAEPTAAPLAAAPASADEPAVPEKPEEPEEPRAQVDADLRKARLAAEADILTDPADRSALHYYGRVLTAAPGHEVATAELNAVLGRLAVSSSGLLADQRYREAYALSVKVASIRPDHALVNEVQQTLDQLSGGYVTEAMQLAEAGDAEAALATLAQAESLPGRNRQYFQAVKDSIADLLKTKADAQAELIETEKAAAALETAAWMESVRGAISEGRLISPADNSAVSFINLRTADDEIAVQLRQEVFTAILADASSDLEAGALDRAGELLEAAVEIRADSTEVDELGASLEQAYVDRESARVLPMNEFVRLTTVPAEYPRRAEERGISGWVEVVFTVTPSGDTADIAIASAEPEAVFDEPAVEAVEQWTFEPRQYRGQTIAQRATAKLVFRIQ
jgi:TonB family protein